MFLKGADEFNEEIKFSDIISKHGKNKAAAY